MINIFDDRGQIKEFNILFLNVSKSMSRRLTHQDLDQVRSSIDTTITQNKSLEQLHTCDDSSEESFPGSLILEIYENDINKKRKLIDHLVCIANSLVHDASTLIEGQQSAAEQNSLLLASLENLQNDHQFLKEQNQSLRNLLLQSAHNIQKCQQQKDQLIFNNRKIEEEFTQLNHIFQSEKSKLQDQLSALTAPQLNIPSNRQFQLWEQNTKSLQQQLAQMKALFQEQKQVNLLLKKQLELAEISLKESQQKNKGKQPQIQGNATIYDASFSSNQLFQRKNLKNQLQNSLLENLEEIKLISSIQRQEGINQLASETMIFNMENSLSTLKKNDTSLEDKCLEEEPQFTLEQIIQEKPNSQTGIMPLLSHQSIRPNTQNHISFIIDKVENEEQKREDEEKQKDFKKQKRLWMKSLEKQQKILKQLTKISAENQKKNDLPKFDRQKFENKILQRKTALLSEFGPLSRHSSKQTFKSP